MEKMKKSQSDRPYFKKVRKKCNRTTHFSSKTKAMMAKKTLITLGFLSSKKNHYNAICLINREQFYKITRLRSCAIFACGASVAFHCDEMLS